jgi:predicted DNA-binding transcriptional regulator AlpA
MPRAARKQQVRAARKQRVHAPRRQRARAARKQRVLLSFTEVAARRKCHTVTIWRLMKRDPTFPRPFRLGPRMVCFYEDEIDEYEAKEASKRLYVAA